MKAVMVATTIGTVVVSVILVVTLSQMGWSALQKGALRRHRSTAEAMVDLLNYGVLEADGVVRLKNGGLLAVFRYRAPDAGSSTAHEQNALADSLARALQPLGSGWMIHVDAVRRPVAAYAETVRFPDTVSAAIDEERRAFFESQRAVFEGEFYLSVTYLPSRGGGRFQALLLDDHTDGEETAGGRQLALFRRELEALENRLPLHLERLGARFGARDGGEYGEDAMLTWLQHCVTGLEHPVATPRAGVFLDSLLGGQDVEFVGDDLKIGSLWLQVVAIDGFPLMSCPGILNHLAELPCGYRWSTRAIFLDSHEGVQHLQQYRRKWQQKVRRLTDQFIGSHSGPVDRHAVDMVYDADAAISALNSGEVGPAYYTGLVVIFHEDLEQAKHAARATARVVRRLGCTAARIEDLNLMEAYLGSLPGHGVQNVRRPLLNTLDVADLIPTSSLWAGENQAPCPYYPAGSPALLYGLTSGSTPFRLNLHVGDVGHTLMFGPTGAGKSTHLALLAAQLRRYEGMRVFVFDKGLSLYALASAIAAVTDGCSGLHFEVASDRQRLRFAPLRLLEHESDRKWAMEWVDQLLALNGLQTSPAQRSEIGRAVVNMHQTGARSMSELVMTLQDREMSTVLRQYTSDAPMGFLLDAEDDNIKQSDFTVFEIEELMTLNDRLALPILTYLFRRVERQLDGCPAAIILDEAWVMLGHPVFRDKIREWLKVLRKANCLVVLATQSLSDASRSGILDVLVESCPTKIYLPNANAVSEEGCAMYKRMGLNERQIELIAAAKPKRDYYVTSSAGQRLYELALGPLALALCSASGKQDIATIRTLEAKYGRGWLQAWLQAKGVPARLWEALQ